MMRFVSFLVLVLWMADCRAIEPLPIDALWQTESFRKAYTGSYGIDSKIEPLINEDESFYLSEAAQLMADGERKQAIEKLKQSELLDESPAIQFSLGNFYFEEGEPELAIEHFREAIKQFPRFRDAHRNLAMVLLQEDEVDEAEAHLKKAVELGSQEGLTLGLLAYCHVRKERFQAGLSAYRLARVTMPDSFQWKVGEAFCLHSLGEFRKAASIYGELIEANREDLSLWINRADAFVRLQEFDRAIAHLEMAKRLGGIASSSLTVLGDLYLDMDLSAPALENYLAAVPGMNDVKQVEVLQRLVARGFWSGAKQFGNQVREKQRDSSEDETGNKQRSSFDRLMAIVAMETGDRDKAAESIRELLEDDPLDGDAMLLLARYHQQNQELDQAIVYLEQAAAVPDKRAQALLEHGKILVSEGQLEEALPLLRESNRLQPFEHLADYIDEIESISGN